MNILELIIEEIRCSYKLILLGITIAMTMMGVVIVFYNLTGYIMPAISNQYDKDLEHGLSTNIQRLNLEDFEVFNEIGAENIVLKSADSKKFSESTLKIEDKNIEIFSKEYRWLYKENYDLITILAGVKCDEFNNSENALIYCSSEDMEKFEIGDTLSLYLKNGKLVSEYKVLKVIHDGNADEPYAVLPSKSVIQKMDEKGIYISYSFECTLPKASKYVEAKKVLLSYGADCSCDFDETLELVSTLKLVFKILAIVFVVISIFVIVTIAIININTREKFFVLQKVLGAVDGNIILIYMVILELQIIIADFIGCILGIKFTEHLTNVVHNLYEMEYGIGNVNIVTMFLNILVVSNIAVIPFCLIIKRIIDNKDIISIINNKEC